MTNRKIPDWLSERAGWYAFFSLFIFAMGFTATQIGFLLSEPAINWGIVAFAVMCLIVFTLSVCVFISTEIEDHFGKSARKIS